MITLSRNERTHIETGLPCRWSSSRLPYLFNLSRQDAQITNIADIGGFVAIGIQGIQMALIPIAVDDVVTFVSYDGVYKSAGKITTIIQNGTPDYYFTTDIPFIGNAVSGYVNFSIRENYKFKIRITTTIEGIVSEIGQYSITHNKLGEAVVDVQNALTLPNEKVNFFAFDVVNKKDLFSGLSNFNIEYKDIFFVNEILMETTAYAMYPFTYYVVDGVKYLLQKYGQNFCDYVMQETTATTLAKFLTEFEKPVYFAGYPFSLSFIFPAELGTRLMTTEEDELNSLGSVVNHLDANIDTSQAGAVNLLTMIGGYGAGTTDVDVWIESGGVAGQNYVADDYVANDYVTDDEAIVGSPEILTIKQRVELNTDCRLNPIYLMWFNSLGGWSYWLFDCNAESIYTSQQGQLYALQIEDIEYNTQRERITEARQMKTINVGGVVTKQQMEGIKSIERSPAIYMLMDITLSNPATSWLGVKISPKGFKTFAKAENVEIEIGIVLPEYFNTAN